MKTGHIFRLASAAILMTAALQSSADIKVNFNQQPSSDALIVQHILISDIAATPKTRNADVITDTVRFTGNTAILPVSDAGNSRYRIALADAPASTRDYFIDFYASPGDDITVEVKDTDPLVYTVSGTPLMDGIAAINKSLEPLEEQLALIQSGQLPQSAFTQLAVEYDKILTDYIDANPSSPAALYALLSLDDEAFDKYFALMDPVLTTTPLYPFVLADKAQREEQHALAARQDALKTGQIPAPDFTLKDLKGNNVSLSDFRGKWVVLDFWGSWCIWCIKGFPELKKTYEKYAGKLEIIGIDCRDSEQAWKAAVAKYKLPWVNLYNPDKPGNLAEVYPVQGFPTKIIINPDGNIADIFTGEVPQFYTRLAELIE